MLATIRHGRCSTYLPHGTSAAPCLFLPFSRRSRQSAGRYAASPRRTFRFADEGAQHLATSARRHRRLRRPSGRIDIGPQDGHIWAISATGQHSATASARCGPFVDARVPAAMNRKMACGRRGSDISLMLFMGRHEQACHRQMRFNDFQDEHASAAILDRWR